MQKVSELVSKNIGNTITNFQTWGGILYNVKSYDAVGDGVANDIAAIQAAIDAANAAGGGIVFFPKGTYLITGTALTNVKLYSGVSLCGIGADSIIQSNKTLTASTGASSEKTNMPLFKTWQYRQTGEALVEDILIENLQFVGRNDPTTESFSSDYEFYAGVAVSGIQGLTIRNCIFRNFHGDGILVDASHTDIDFNRNINIYNNKGLNNFRGSVTLVSGIGMQVHDNDLSGEDFGIHLEPGTATEYKTLQAVHVYHNNIHDITASTPLWIGNAVNSVDSLSDVHIVDNDFRDCTGSSRSPFISFSGYNMVFSKNRIRNCHTTGQIFFRAAGAFNQIEGNMFYDCTVAGAGASFLQQQTYPVTGTPDYSEIAGFNWSNNHFSKCTGPTVGSTSNCFMTVFGPQENRLSKFHGNTIITGGFYYGLFFDEGQFSIMGNSIKAEYIISPDILAGQRGIFNGSASTNSQVVGNFVTGWSAADIYRNSEKAYIGHNFGDLYHSGFTATSDIDMFTKNLLIGGKKHYFGTVAPTTGTWAVGDTVHNTAPTLLKNISHWKCITAGTSGVWTANGCGTGTTANRPTLGTNDAGYLYYDTTTTTKIFWTGTVWA